MTKLRMIATAALGVTMTLAPVSGFAKDHNGKGNGNGNGRGQARVQVQQPVDLSRDRTIIVQTNRAAVGHCPPGLAKKDPACVPPGQAKKAGQGFVVGDILDLGSIHIINQPGLYGLGEPPLGNRYAIIDGRLVRVESETGRLLSIIRLVDAILD